MKTFLLIAYVAPIVITTLYIILVGLQVKREFLKNNPDAKFHKSAMDFPIALLRYLVLVGCPVFNIVVMFVCIFKYEDLVDEIYEDLDDRAYYGEE